MSFLAWGVRCLPPVQGSALSREGAAPKGPGRRDNSYEDNGRRGRNRTNAGGPPGGPTEDGPSPPTLMSLTHDPQTGSRNGTSDPHNGPVETGQWDLRRRGVECGTSRRRGAMSASSAERCGDGALKGGTRRRGRPLRGGRTPDVPRGPEGRVHGRVDCLALRAPALDPCGPGRSRPLTLTEEVGVKGGGTFLRYEDRTRVTRSGTRTPAPDRASSRPPRALTGAPGPRVSQLRPSA